MDFVIIMIFMTIMFLTSKAESDRKIGWTIVGVVFFLYLLGTIGPALLIILAVIVLLGLIWLFSSDGPVTKSESKYIDYKPTHSEKSKPIVTKKASVAVNNIETSNVVKVENTQNENNQKSVINTGKMVTTSMEPEPKRIDEFVKVVVEIIPENPAVVIPVEQKEEPKTTFYHEVEISKPEKEIRHEEKKVRTNKTASTTKKKSIENEIETDKKAAEKIMFKDSILQNGLAIGEMEWMHIDKGSEAEDKIPPKEYFATIKEAVDEYSISDGYVRVMIERNNDGSLTECPALIWKDNFFLNVLPLIRKSPVKCWPLRMFESVAYKVIADVDPDATYNEIGKQEIANEFEDKFPEYKFDGKYGTYTTTFIFPEGLEITNTSAKELFKLLEPEFVVEDDIMSSDVYGIEVKELYKKYILWENGIIDAKEYNDAKEKFSSFCEKPKLEQAKELRIL